MKLRTLSQLSVMLLAALIFTAVPITAAPALQATPPPRTSASGVALEVGTPIYSGDGRQVDIPLTVTNLSVAEGVSGGRYHTERTADGKPVKWITLFRAIDGPIPYPARETDAPVWEFIVTLDDGTQFPAFAGCLYRDKVIGFGWEFAFYWELELEGSWFDCGNAYQVKPPDMAVGQSGSTVLTVYLQHPTAPHPELLPRRHVKHLDFFAYTPAGRPLGLVASVDLLPDGSAASSAPLPAPVATPVPVAPVSAPPANVPSTTGVALEVGTPIYSGDGRQVDIPLTVTNLSVAEGVSGGRYYPERTADGKPVKWVTLFQAADGPIPYPIRDDAPVWEFNVTLDDGTQFPAFAGCLYRDKVIGFGWEFAFYWELELQGSWFDCGNAYQVKPPDMAVGQSGSTVLTVYLQHPTEPHPELLPRRHVKHLDFFAYTPAGRPLGLVASVDLQ